MRIISASRRTDIAAHHADWFMNRIDEGFVDWKNPFSGAQYRTSLKVEDVAAILFWSKDYRPLAPHLPGLEARGYGFVLHLTITGLGVDFEPRVPAARESVDSMKRLGDMFGPRRVIWRYDPVLVSSRTDFDFHRANFGTLASELDGVVQRCYFSFPTFYAKTQRSLSHLESQSGIRCFDPPLPEKIEFAQQMAAIASAHGMSLHACCCDELIGGPVLKARCVDGDLLTELFGDRISGLRRKRTRSQCGCYESTDIGAYDTCPSGCVYCYANSNARRAETLCSQYEIQSTAL